nr:hypothetical protein [Tanacetum cinerariifolium]
DAMSFDKRISGSHSIMEDRSDRSSVGSFWSNVEDLRHGCGKGYKFPRTYLRHWYQPPFRRFVLGGISGTDLLVSALGLTQPKAGHARRALEELDPSLTPLEELYPSLTPTEREQEEEIR